jgi:nucleoside-diphosphate-sugar epimerase
MKIVITGANGFVGASLCRYFYQHGHQVIATGRQEKPNAKLLEYASYIQADITKPIKHFDADVCIHAAGLASDTADYEELFLNNVTGTQHVLAAAKSCQYFIFISSSSVYDFTAKPAIESDASLIASLSDYGKTKLLAEELVTANIPARQQRLILRPRAIYGIGDRLLLSRILKLLRWQMVFYPADNRLQTSATHINNIAYAIELFLGRQNKLALQLFNIADDQVYLLKDLTLKMLNVVEGRSLKVVNIPPGVIRSLAYVNPKQVSPLALKTLTKHSILDLEHIKNTLGYQPLHTFDNSYKEIGVWVNNLGGKKVYMNNLNDVPWMF